MIGGVFFRLGGAFVLGVAGAGGGLFDCASFIDRGLNVRSSVLYLVGAIEEALEEEGGDVFGAALLELVAAGEGEEGFAGGGGRSSYESLSARRRAGRAGRVMGDGAWPCAPTRAGARRWLAEAAR